MLPWRPAVGGLWLVGGAAMFLWRFCGWLWLRRLFSRAVAPPDWLSAMSAQIAARMRVAAPRLRLSDTAFGPALVGVLRPVLVFPAALVSRLQPWQFEAVLAHEIAHLRRFDPVWYFLQRCLEAAFSTILPPGGSAARSPPNARCAAMRSPPKPGRAATAAATPRRCSRSLSFALRRCGRRRRSLPWARRAGSFRCGCGG
ncbi:MAG: M56 family metallopeptidase [Verrucomicrobiales bacterium]